MNFKILNKQHIVKINGTIELLGQADFKWEDDDLDNIVLGSFNSQPDRSYYSKDAKSILREINKNIYDYNGRKLQVDEFAVKIKDLISKDRSIQTYIPSHYYETQIKKQKSCVIVGPGGMGKSHYVKYIEEKLSNKKIAHLCVYGKYIANSDDIDWDELITLSNIQEFVLIIDAYNELPQSLQKVFLKNIESFMASKFSRVFVTYRTNTLDGSIESCLNNLLKNVHDFLGVSYEDTIDLLVENYGIDIFKFEDIAYSNNALCLKMLVKTIDSLQHIDKLDYISSIYYLIEQYIKKSIDTQAWDNTKELAKLLYNEKNTYFSIEQLPKSIRNPRLFIEKMIEFGFIIHAYEDKYTFTNETIVNYLMSRFFIQSLKKNDIQQNLKQISKWKNNWGMHDVILESVFEKYKDNVDVAIELIKNSFLNDSFNFLSLRSIKFPLNSIEKIKNRIALTYPTYECFFNYAGYEYSPFNCINYCSAKFVDNPDEIIVMCKNKTDYHLVGQLRYRLRNILHLIKHINSINRRTDEYLLTAIWASALTDSEIHVASSKILFELAQKFPSYIKTLCDYYKSVCDDDIKENIVFSLSYQSKKHSDILNPFFETILNDEQEINSHILAYASQYLNNQLGYIDVNKRDISKEYLDLSTNKKIFHYADIADMHQQYWIGFRTNYNTSGISIIDGFLKANKHIVNLWNVSVDKKYHCMINGQCSGWTNVEDEILGKNVPSFDYKDIFTDNELFSMFQGVFEETAERYHFDADKDDNYDYQHYLNSFIAKLLSISSKRFFGSLMSNYYMDSFINYPSRRNMVGFKVYDPFEYDDESPSIVAPISKYNDIIDIAERRLLKCVTYDGEKDSAWANDVELSRNNLLSLINSELSLEGKRWSPLVVIVNNAEHTSDTYSKMINSDNYNVFATFNEEYELDETGRNRKYTIELLTANCNINDYPLVNESSVCHQVKSFLINPNASRTSRMILPPPAIIKELDLHFDPSTATWKNGSNEDIILCDNNKSDKYQRAISTIILIRKDAFDEVCRVLKLKYFAFTERYINIPGIGYGNECDNHYQIENGYIKKCVKNTGADYYENTCDSCPFDMLDIHNSNSIDSTNYEDILKELGFEDYTS